MVAIPLLLGHGKRVAACCVLRVAPLGFDVPRCRAGRGGSDDGTKEPDEGRCCCCCSLLLLPLLPLLPLLLSSSLCLSSWGRERGVEKVVPQWAKDMMMMQQTRRRGGWGGGRGEAGGHQDKVVLRCLDKCLPYCTNRAPKQATQHNTTQVHTLSLPACKVGDEWRPLCRNALCLRIL